MSSNLLKNVGLAAKPILLCVGIAATLSSPMAFSVETYVNEPHKDTIQELMRLRTEGVAHYESGIAQKKALASFESALTIEGAGALDHYNLGVILKKLNRIAESKEALIKAIKIDSNMAQPYYLLGLIFLDEENNAEALKYFKQAAKLAPNESSAHYQLSRLYREMDDKSKALQSIVETLRLDSYHTGALYQLYLSHQQSGDKEKAQQIFKEFSRLKKAFGKTRLEINPDESALAKPMNGNKTVKKLPFGTNSSPIQFTSANDILAKGVVSYDFGDVNRDQKQDLVVGFESGIVQLFLGDGKGAFKESIKTEKIRGVYEVELVGLQRGMPYTVVVRTSDGLSSVAILDANAKPKDPKAKHHNANSSVPKPFEIKFGSVESLHKGVVESMVIADYDHDGDTDFVLNEFSVLLVNRGDAKFDTKTDILPKKYNRLIANRVVNANGDDLRNQIAVDFVISAKDGKRYILLDDMGGTYKLMPELLPDQKGVLWQDIADMDNNGYPDIVSLVKGAMVVDYNHGGLNFKTKKHHHNLTNISDALIADLDNDGQKDLLVSDSKKGLIVFGNEGNTSYKVQSQSAGDLIPKALKSFDIDSDGVQDLVYLNAQGQLKAAKNTTNTEGANWITVWLEGIRSAADGRATQIEVRYGSYYAKYQAEGNLLHIPIGQAKYAELLRITWPNGFVENKFSIQPKNTWYFAESERISGSCPSIFSWDGEKYVYITDAFISGPMGVPTGPDTYFPVGDDEYVKISGEHLKADENGIFKVSVTEELKEVTYIDQALLYAVDYPENYFMFPNEYLMPPIFPEFKLHLSAAPEYSLQAMDHKGNDVTDLIKDVDYTYPHDFSRLDFTGFAETNSVELFLSDYELTAENLRMFLTGWFYYFDSTSLMAAAQHPDVNLIWPQVQAYKDGEWVFVERIGIPPGKEKTVIVDIGGKIPEGAEKIRVITNLEMYWDRIFLDFGVEPAQSVAQVHQLNNISSTLRLHGFSKLIRPEGEFPMPDRFDYHTTSYRSLWNPLDGLYTRYGNVNELTDDMDGKMAVFSSGDELALVFDGSHLPAVKPGYKRDYLIYLNGFVKDGDKYTAHAGTVEPMPFKGMKSYPYTKEQWDQGVENKAEYKKYLDEYQTREPLRFVGPNSNNFNF